MPSSLQHHLLRGHSNALSSIYSVCSAHPWVIRAACEQAVETRTPLLIEATSNQVNQFGGYTGMRPEAFRDFVLAHAQVAGLDSDLLILGGDHLGPNPWRTLQAEEAMQHAETMVAEYVRAGFTKIHLDASMACAGDPEHLSDETVAGRAVRLCQAAEKARGTGPAPVYVIGTEVPTPGGATHSLDGLQVTTTDSATHTLAIHRDAFQANGLGGVWPRVIALVVQPGVEFGHDEVISYDREKAKSLVAWLRDQPEEIVFEAHSTDYQLPKAYGELVEDGFAILKVGPALTFAMREALYALEDIEAQLVSDGQRSFLPRVVENAMLREAANWQSYYPGSEDQQRLLRVYSYSDRIRYYWHLPEIARAVNQLIANLSSIKIPETMYSRYLPAQYARIRTGEIASDPASLVVDRVRDVLRVYAQACD